MMYDINYTMTGERSQSPTVFNVETTNACNMNCPMCPRSEMTRDVEDMDMDTFLRIIDQIKPHDDLLLGKWYDHVENILNIPRDEQSEDAFYHYISSRCLTLHGWGEPLLDPTIVAKVQACTDRNIPTYFSCKPQNITEELLYKLDKAGLTVLKFAMDYVIYTISFDYMISDYRGDMKIVFSLVMKEENNWSRFAETFQNRGFCAYVKSLDNRWYSKSDAPPNKSHYMRDYCRFPWSSMSILSNGDVVPCTQDYNGEMRMGNIHRHSLEKIWNNDRYEFLRRAHETGDYVPFKCLQNCDIPRRHEHENRR